MRHDHTIPRADLARLGTHPTEQQVLELWSQLLDQSLANTSYGNLSTSGKFDDWLTRQYMNGQANFEDVNGEGGDALGAWAALSIRGLLKPEHQDFNRFKSIRQLLQILRTPEYRNQLRRIADQAEIEKHKKDRQEIVLINNDRFFVVIPLNYGSCYTFNRDVGFQATFCTGSSSGQRWFDRYSKDGPIVSIVDKANINDVNGKWQMHAASYQLNNGDQSISRSSGDIKVAELFPGLLKQIVYAMKQKANEIQKASESIVSGGWNMDRAISEIEHEFPRAYASEAPTDAV
jgi:hypothetical protein